MDEPKQTSEKKRPGDSSTLPEASKKAKVSEKPLFQTNSRWNTSSTGFSKTANVSTEKRDLDHGNSTSASSASSHPPTPSTSGALPPAPRKGAFGFSANPRVIDHAKKKPQNQAPRKSTEPPVPLPSAPLLPLPTVESTLPARYIAEGMHIDQALANVVGAENSASTGTPNSNSSTKPLIILDSANVSHEFGQGVFSTQGLPVAVKYFKSRGFPVVAFLPEHYLSQHYPDPLQDWTALEALVAEKILIPTPGADYDDLYIVQHARRRNGVIVTRDRYRDVPLLFNDPVERAEVAKWIKQHRIPFKFEGDVFVPLSVPKGFPLDPKA